MRFLFWQHIIRVTLWFQLKATDCGYVIAGLWVPGRQIRISRAHKQGRRLFFAEQAIFTVNMAAISG